MIQAIETEYNGYRFRSRLEARWAVFFDAIGWKYRYEPQGFEFGEIRYLPDFLLPDYGMYIEVKPAWPKDGVYDRIRLLALHLAKDARTVEIQDEWDESPRNIYLCRTSGILCGSPWATEGNLEYALIEFHPMLNVYNVGENFGDTDKLIAPDNITLDEVGVEHSVFLECRRCHSIGLDTIETHYPGHEFSCGQISYGCCERARAFGPTITRAYKAARSARFEFGETPQVR